MDGLLNNLKDDILDRVLQSGHVRLYARDETIFFEGDRPTFLPIVLSGRVKVVQFPEPGKEIILGLFHSGDAFAIPPAIDGHRFPATAIALDNSKLLLIPREKFLSLMQTSPEFSRAITTRMCGILRERVNKVQILSKSSAEQRIATLLLRIADESADAGPLKIEYRRQDLAEMAGLSLEATIRTIRRLARKNCLRIIGGRVVLESTDRLRKIVNTSAE